MSKKKTIVQYSKVQAGDVTKLLREKYKAPEYAYLTEVRNATGYSRRDTYADGIAMSLWPSRGLEVMGFEIKVSRSDLLQELRALNKSAPIQKYCDRWHLVLGRQITQRRKQTLEVASSSGTVNGKRFDQDSGHGGLYSTQCARFTFPVRSRRSMR